MYWPFLSPSSQEIEVGTELKSCKMELHIGQALSGWLRKNAEKMETGPETPKLPCPNSLPSSIPVAG